MTQLKKIYSKHFFLSILTVLIFLGIAVISFFVTKNNFTEAACSCPKGCTLLYEGECICICPTTTKAPCDPGPPDPYCNCGGTCTDICGNEYDGSYCGGNKVCCGGQCCEKAPSTCACGDSCPDGCCGTTEGSYCASGSCINGSCSTDGGGGGEPTIPSTTKPPGNLGGPCKKDNDCSTPGVIYTCVNGKCTIPSDSQICTYNVCEQDPITGDKICSPLSYAAPKSATCLKNTCSGTSCSQINMCSTYACRYWNGQPKCTIQLYGSQNPCPPLGNSDCCESGGGGGGGNSCSVTATATPNPIPTGQNQTTISATNLRYTSLSKCKVSGYSLPHTFTQTDSSHIYTVTCTGDTGYDDCSSDVTVTKEGTTACSVSLSAFPNPVRTNEDTTLTATVSNCTLPIKQYTWYVEDPAKSSVSIYTNSGNQNCTTLCSSYSKPCVSIGTDEEATNGYYFNFDFARLRCQVRGSGTCSTNPSWSTSLCSYFTRCRCDSSGYQTTTSNNILTYNWSREGTYKAYVIITDSANKTAQSNDVYINVTDAISRYACDSTSGCIISSSPTAPYTTSNCDSKCIKRCVGDTCQYSDNTTYTKTCSSSAECTVTPPPTGCEIDSFQINGKDDKTIPNPPLVVFANTPLIGSFSVNDQCYKCVVTNDNPNAIWGDTTGTYYLINYPVTGGYIKTDPPFTITNTGLYNYTLQCTSDPSKDPKTCTSSDPACAIDTTSLGVDGGGVKVINLPWWREIIPNLEGFLRGLFR